MCTLVTATASLWLLGNLGFPCLNDLIVFVLIWLDLVRPWQIDDLKDRLVSGSEGSRAMREIRTRDPSFDMNNFVRAVKVSIIGGAVRFCALVWAMWTILH